MSLQNSPDSREGRLVIGRHWNEYFDFFHVYFWQATQIAMIVGVLYGWIKLFGHR